MTKKRPGERIAIQLDTRLPLEAIILNRLHGLPTNRRQEWLRGLLVQGFRLECQTLRGGSDETKHSPKMAFVPRFAYPKQETKTRLPDKSVVLPLTSPSVEKPFAALGKVIG